MVSLDDIDVVVPKSIDDICRDVGTSFEEEGGRKKEEGRRADDKKEKEENEKKIERRGNAVRCRGLAWNKRSTTTQVESSCWSCEMKKENSENSNLISIGNHER